MAGHGWNCTRQARATFLWTSVFFLTFEITGAILVERGLPEARDPDFMAKLDQLRARQRELPGSPLVLMLGSSRTSLGFQAGRVRATRDGRPALIFNFGLSGGGPFTELLSLRRLVAAGIRPDLLFIELLPPVFNQGSRHSLEEIWLQGSRLRQAEIAQMSRFHSDPQRLVRRWLRCRLLPWSALHRSLEQVLTPGWVEPPTAPGHGHIDPFGWEPHFVDGITDQYRARYLEIARSQYRESMENFQLAEQPVGALRAILELCQRTQVQCALILMPEGTEFTALYPAAMRQGLSRFVADLGRLWQVPVIDARGWVPDNDLWDSHHALPSGAAIFTERLEREAIRPLLQNLSLKTEPRLSKTLAPAMPSGPPRLYSTLR
jgi:hypothetical protein